MSLIGKRRSAATDTDETTRALIRQHVTQIKTRIRDLLMIAETIPENDAISLREFSEAVTDAINALEAETKLLDGATNAEPVAAEPA